MISLFASLFLAVAATQHSPAHAEGGHESLSDVMLHHVSDGYTLEFPWVCEGGFKWDCELDLRHIFGDSLVFGSLDMTPSKHLIMMWLGAIGLLGGGFPGVQDKTPVPRGS